MLMLIHLISALISVRAANRADFEIEGSHQPRCTPQPNSKHGALTARFTPSFIWLSDAFDILLIEQPLETYLIKIEAPKRRTATGVVDSTCNAYGSVNWGADEADWGKIVNSGSYVPTLHREFHTVLFIDNATCTKRDVKEIKILTKQSYVF